MKRWSRVQVLVTFVILTGCSSSKSILVVPSPSLPTGLPTPAAPGPINTYLGAQSPGEWTLTLNNTADTYSFQPTTYPASPPAPTAGSLTISDGFTSLGPSGYALEIEGRAAVLRPGDVTAPPVFAVPQTECYPINGRLRFQYIGMQTGPDNTVGSAGPTFGYGSFVASTDSTGQTWQFENLQGNIVSGPASFAGTCSTSASSATIELSGQTILNDLWPPNEEVQTSPTSGTLSNLWIGPSGFVAADQSDPTLSPPTGASIAGVAEPSSSLQMSDIISHAYLGFLYEPATYPYGGSTLTPSVTSPVAFGRVSYTGTMMIGGDFPNDDVTQTPNSDMVIDLGLQNPTYNGLYSAVSITVLDPDQNCANYTGSGEVATSGFNLQGYITCTFGGVAVAGNPDGKYAIFISSYNWAAQLGGAPMQFYLFQQ